MKSMGAVLGAMFLTASCTMGPVHVEEDFGSSVRQMVDAQISDPTAAAEPSSRPPDRLDGVTAEEVLSGYRKGARRKGDVEREIPLSID